jgi:hypothetical protein
MKHIRKFNENNKEKISFEEAKQWIKDKYSELKVAEMLDEEISSGNWVDKDQMEEEGYDSEYDYYVDYGRGEAESEVMDQIVSELRNNFELSFDPHSDDNNIYDFLSDEFNLRIF